jgi:hypothetical protein
MPPTKLKPGFVEREAPGGWLDEVSWEERRNHAIFLQYPQRFQIALGMQESSPTIVQAQIPATIEIVEAVAKERANMSAKREGNDPSMRLFDFAQELLSKEQPGV